MGIELVISVGS